MVEGCRIGIPNRNEEEMPQKVSKIIDNRIKEWRTEAIKDYISNEQDLAIKAIPFSKIGGKDRILWPYIENGVYTVKTRYHVMKNEKGRDMSVRSSRLKQSSRIWYKHRSEYLMKEGYKNDLICPSVFIKKSEIGFAIIAVYVDDMNLIGTP